MSLSKRFRAPGIVLLAGLGLLAWRGGLSTVAAQEGSAPQPATAAVAAPQPIDEFERAALVWTYSRAGKTGAERGQEIFYTRCWTCHSEYARASDPTPVPSLIDIFERRSVEEVTLRIRRGATRMPAYTTATLSESDLADLLAHMRQKCGKSQKGAGCFDAHNPPKNPRFRAQWVQGLP